MADCGLPQLLIGQAIIPVIGCIRIGVIERPELVIGKCLIRTELVTSIINPSHKLTPRQPASFTSEDGVSLMRVVNDELTVSELIDLVAYLQPKYKVTPYRTSDYRLYQLRIPSEPSKD